MKDTDEFFKVENVRNQIINILNKNGMMMTVRYSNRIIVEKVCLNVTDTPISVTLYGDL